MLYLAIGILGATAMPHNLYLLLSNLQTRKYEQRPKANGGSFATIDSWR
jgi:Mn2+/Fe2+ NRAMP family transporter